MQMAGIFFSWEDNLWCERYGGNKKAVFLLVQPQMGRKWRLLSLPTASAASFMQEDVI